MLIYIVWFILSLIFLFVTLKSSKSVQNATMSFFMIAIGIFVGLGDMLGGYDRYIYGDVFDSIADARIAGLNPWETDAFAMYGTEFGYGAWQVLMSHVTANRYIFIFVTTMVIYILLIISLRRYVDNAPFAVVMFMGLWFFFTFTYLRQVMGCTVCWLAIRYIIKRNLPLFLLVTFIGYSFHNSAIILFPMYFVPMKKFPIKWVMGVMVAALLIGLTPIPQGLFDTYGDVNEERIGVEGYAMDAGFRWAYLMEAVFFLFAILTNYKQIANKRKEVVMLNMALVFCAILLVFVRSENGGRLGWYYMIGVICTMTNICYSGQKLLRNGVFMLFVSFYLFYRILDAWAFNMTPYKTFLTPGHTAAEWIYEKYEYAPQYDMDKFYR